MVKCPKCHQAGLNTEHEEALKLCPTCGWDRKKPLESTGWWEKWADKHPVLGCTSILLYAAAFFFILWIGLDWYHDRGGESEKRNEQEIVGYTFELKDVGKPTLTITFISGGEIKASSTPDWEGRKPRVDSYTWKIKGSEIVISSPGYDEGWARRQKKSQKWRNNHTVHNYWVLRNDGRSVSIEWIASDEGALRSDEGEGKGRREWSSTPEYKAGYRVVARRLPR